MANCSSVSRFMAFAVFVAVIAATRVLSFAAAPGAGLIAAVENGDHAALAASLQGKVDVNARGADGSTALIWAAHRNDLDAVNLLLEANAEVSAANAYGVTALMQASAHGNAAMIEELLKAGADPNAASTEGQTPLLSAARSGSADAVRVLLNHGAQVDAQEGWRRQTALMWAAAANHPDTVQLLIEHGASVNSRSTVWPQKQAKKEDGNLVTPPPKGGLTALLYAARQGSLEAARVLVKARADLDQTEPDGISPVLMALLNAHYDLAAMLLEAGADPNVTDKYGRAALYAAIDMYTLEPSVTRPAPRVDDVRTGLDVARIALRRGADANARLVEPAPGRGPSDYPDPILRAGTTPFIRAAKTGDVKGMKLLLDFGADPHRTTQQGVTALMAAAGLGWKYGDSQVAEADALAAVELCLELGIGVNAVTEKGQTALHGAAARGGDRIVETLVRHGARLDAEDKDGRTPLHIAKGIDPEGNPEKRIPGYASTAALLLKLQAQTSPLDAAAANRATDEKE